MTPSRSICRGRVHVCGYLAAAVRLRLGDIPAVRLRLGSSAAIGLILHRGGLGVNDLRDIAYGGTLPKEDFAMAEFRARKRIDYLTDISRIAASTLLVAASI